MISMMLLSLVIGVQDSEIPDLPPPPPKEPPLVDDHGLQVVQAISPHCSKEGCTEFARWRPVLLLGGYDWEGKIPVELAMGVCTTHQGKLENYFDKAGWDAILVEFRKNVQATGKKIRDPKRHLSSVEHLALAPRWANFALDTSAIMKLFAPDDAPKIEQVQPVLNMDSASSWVQMLEGLRAARNIEGENIVQIANVIMGLVGAENVEVPLFAMKGFGRPMQEWAWEAGVDLVGLAMIGEAVMRGSAKAPAPPAEAPVAVDGAACP